MSDDVATRDRTRHGTGSKGRETGTKSVAEKLLIKPSTAVWTSHPTLLHLIEPMPEEVRVVADLAQAATAVVFAEDAGALRNILAAHNSQLVQPATLWIAYPKANRTDVNRDTLWPILAESGLRPVSQVAINDVWSALRFRPLNAGEAPSTGGA